MNILCRERGAKAKEQNYKCFNGFDLYTGAHDKNYDEIFENDIVKYNDEYYAVVYKNCGFVLKKDLELPSIDYRLGSIDYSKCEIVGTVYSDLKLLENNDTKICCVDCAYLTLSYGECAKGYIRGVVKADDSCGHGVKQTKGAKK